jgi:uncharacterized peroxidase-related enzyme
VDRPEWRVEDLMFIDAIPEEDATDEVAAYYAGQRSAWGFLPNYAACFSSRPDVARAWNSLNATIRDAMDRRRFELATIAAARELRSTYCTAAHSKFLRDVCGDGQSLIEIAQDTSGASLEGLDREVYRFAAKVARDASSITGADVGRLREAGLSDAEVADVVFAVAARAFFTKVLDGLGAQLDVETAATFEPELLASMIVGRPVADR